METFPILEKELLRHFSVCQTEGIQAFAGQEVSRYLPDRRYTANKK